MWSVDNSEDVLARHEPEACKSRLEIVDGLPHITLGGKYERSDSVIRVFYLLSFTDLHQARDDLGVCQTGVAEDGTARLKGLDDLVGSIACEGKAGSRGVDFHGASKSLLGARRHAVCFIEYDQFLSAWREGHLLLSETFYAITDDVDTLVSVLA